MKLSSFFVCALLLCGCPEDPMMMGPKDMSVAVPHNFDQINTLVLRPLCGNFSTCHSREGARDAGRLNLMDDPYGELVGVLANNKMAAAEGRVRVKPCDPTNSFLIFKMELPETQSDSDVGYGASMPKKNPHIDPLQLQAIKDWIARGAHKDEPETVSGDECRTDDAGMPDLAFDFAQPHD